MAVNNLVERVKKKKKEASESTTLSKVNLYEAEIKSLLVIQHHWKSKTNSEIVRDALNHLAGSILSNYPHYEKELFGE